MEHPSVATKVYVESTKVTYVVMAYRQLEPEEAKQVVRASLGQQRRKPKPGSTIELHTVIGAND